MTQFGRHTWHIFWKTRWDQNLQCAHHCAPKISLKKLCCMQNVGHTLLQHTYGVKPSIYDLCPNRNSTAHTCEGLMPCLIAAFLAVMATEFETNETILRKANRKGALSHGARTVRARCVHGARTVQCFWDGCPTCTPLNGPHRNTPRVLISTPCSPYWHTRILQFLV